MQLIQVKSQMSMRTMRPRKPESVTGCKELIQTLSGNSGARIVGRSRFIKGIVAIFQIKFEYCDPNANVEFLSRPGCDSDNCYPQELYNMFCGNGGPCTFTEPWPTGGNPTITGSDYTFYAEAVFTFYPDGEDPVECPKSWSASGNALDHCVDGCSGGGYDPPNTPVPTEEGGGGGGSTATPDPDPPGD